MTKLYVSKSEDIPRDWKRYSAQRKTTVNVCVCKHTKEDLEHMNIYPA